MMMSAAKLQADLEDVLIQTIKDRRFLRNIWHPDYHGAGLRVLPAGIICRNAMSLHDELPYLVKQVLERRLIYPDARALDFSVFKHHFVLQVFVIKTSDRKFPFVKRHVNSQPANKSRALGAAEERERSSTR